MLCVHLPCQFVLQTMDDMIITTPPNGFHIVMPIATHHLHTDIYQYCTTNKQTSLQNDHSTLFVFVLLCQCAPLGQLATCTLHTILASTCSLKKQFASRQHSIGRFRLVGIGSRFTGTCNRNDTKAFHFTRCSWSSHFRNSFHMSARRNVWQSKLFL